MHFNFINKSAEDFKNFLRDFPKINTYIDLNHNNLWNRKLQELTQSFPLVQPWVERLNLSVNGLYKLSSIELGDLLASMPITLKQLNLSGNNFEQMEFLSKGIAKVQRTLLELNLSTNGLGFMDFDELTAVIKTFPENLQQLDMSRNHLNQLKTEQLRQIIKILPVHLILLNLSFNSLTFVNFLTILAALPSEVDTLIFSFNDLIAMDSVYPECSPIQSIKLFRLPYKEMKAMNSKQREIIKELLPNLEDLQFTDHNNLVIEEDSLEKRAELATQFGFKIQCLKNNPNQFFAQKGSSEEIDTAHSEVKGSTFTGISATAQ